MKLIINATDNVTSTRLYECAAWYTNLKAIPGEYTLKRIDKTDYPAGTYFVAELDAEITSDNFQSLWAGNAIGKAYDGKQNAGKRDKFSVSISLLDILSHKQVEMTPDETENIFSEVINYLEKSIKDTLSNLRDNALTGTFVDQYGFNMLTIEVNARKLTEYTDKLRGYRECQRNREASKRDNREYSGTLPYKHLTLNKETKS